MSEECYRLSDLIDIVDELIAITNSLPDGYHLRDPLDKKVFKIEVDVVRQRLKDILKQLWYQQKLDK